MIRAVIFDFDGTVADTLPALTEGINRTMEHFSLPLHTVAEVRTYINHGARELCRAALPAAMQRDEEFLDRVLAVYNEKYGEVYHHTTAPYEGVAELIATLHRDYRIGVLSNKQDAYVKLLCAQVLPAGSVDAAQGDIAGHPTKPDPFLSRRIAASLGVSPEECALVGDSDVDFATAKNAGMHHIGVTWGFRTKEQLRAAGVERFADTPREVGELLRSLATDSRRP